MPGEQASDLLIAMFSMKVHTAVPSGIDLNFEHFFVGSTFSVVGHEEMYRIGYSQDQFLLGSKDTTSCWVN